MIKEKNLKLEKKVYEDKDDEQSVKALAKLDQLYTLGNVTLTR